MKYEYACAEMEHKLSCYGDSLSLTCNTGALKYIVLEPLANACV